MKIIDEIMCARFDQRNLPFSLSDNEIKLMQQFMRDDFYVRKFGSRHAALLGSSELRKFLVREMKARI